MSSTLDVFAEGQTIMAYRVEDRHLRSAYGCDKFLGAHHDTVPSRKLRISPCGSDAAKTAQVVGSNPTGPTKNLEAVKILLALFFGLLAFNEPCLRLVGVCFRAPCLQRTLFAAG
jgi:hypothetical protein